MDLKKRPGLKGLMANKKRGSILKDAPDTQVPANLSLPLSPVTTIGLLPNPDLKKKRKVPEVEEGEMIPQKGTIQAENARHKRVPSTESKEETGIDRCRGTRT